MTPTPTAVRRYERDALYFEANREELLRRHGDSWVAVYDEQVVGAASQLDDLLAALDRRGLPRGEVFIERLASEEELLILAAA